MFFPMLRRQAKWVFVFLALVFAVGFVIFGVGSGGGVGLGDLFGGGGGTKSNQPSVSDAREKIAANPKNAAAYRELATALTTEGDVQAATAALARYTQLRPKDTAALSELGGLYARGAIRLQQALAAAQAESQVASGADFGAGFPVPKNQTPPPDPISQAVSTAVNSRVSELTTKTQTAFSKAEGTYRKVAQLNPTSQNVLQLGQIAQQAGDVRTAVSSYQRFIKLAPDDPTVPLVKKQIKTLKQYLQGSSLPVTAGG